MTAMVGNADIAYRVRISHRRNIHFSGEIQIDCYGENGVADVDFSSHVDSEMAGLTSGGAGVAGYVKWWCL
ncbi:hypothetical protein Peur_042182 [Populus x canadensis]